MEYGKRWRRSEYLNDGLVVAEEFTVLSKLNREVYVTWSDIIGS